MRVSVSKWKGLLPDYTFVGLKQYVDLLTHDPRFRIDVRTGHEVVRIDRGGRRLRVRGLATGAEHDEAYDVLVLAPGAATFRPDVPGLDLPGV